MLKSWVCAIAPWPPPDGKPQALNSSSCFNPALKSREQDRTISPGNSLT
ncbi:hypothetical protein [Laspinema palackyanum]|nr:hypothetical protein [Laspinema sp. D2c]